MEKEENRSCPHCGRSLMGDDLICPYCGKKLSRHRSLRGANTLAAVLVLAIALAGIACATGRNPAAEAWTAYGNVVEWFENLRMAELPDFTPAPTLDYRNMPEEELEARDLDAFWRQPGIWDREYPDLTDRERETMEVVASELRIGGESLAEMTEELEERGFSREELLAAVEKCRVDWNFQALLCANRYLSFCTFSKEEMKNQLELEQFTPEQIQYALDNLEIDWCYQTELAVQENLSYSGISPQVLLQILVDRGHPVEYLAEVLKDVEIDWDQQARERARGLLEIESLSRQEMIEELCYEGFTEKQAEAAADAVKLR